MIEARSGPLIDVVAGFAGLREAGRLVIYRSRLLKLRKMTTGARGIEAYVDPGRRAGVTGIASQCRMRA